MRILPLFHENYERFHSDRPAGSGICLDPCKSNRVYILGYILTYHLPCLFWGLFSQNSQVNKTISTAKKNNLIHIL
jgi:hypothetical protein